MKIKSRRFSKTVANDFGTVSLGCLLSCPPVRSLALSLTEWRRSNRAVPQPCVSLCVLCQWQERSAFQETDYHFVINHVTFGAKGKLCACVSVINDISCTQCMTGRLPTLSSPDFLCRFSAKMLQRAANLALAPCFTFGSIENLLCAFFLTALMSSRCHFSV